MRIIVQVTLRLILRRIQDFRSILFQGFQILKDIRYEINGT